LDAAAVAYEQGPLWDHCLNAINAMTIDELLEHLANDVSIVLGQSTWRGNRVAQDIFREFPATLEGAIRLALADALWSAGNDIANH
jgi:hypothetical protein